MEKYIKLANGVKMPSFGLGTFKVENSTESKNAIIHALKNGYKLIDTAQLYNNENLVGQAIKDASITREDIFITTKLKRINITKEEFVTMVESSLKDLQTDYIDLLLIHWPCPTDLSVNAKVWSWLEEYYQKGILKAIGVSNFTIGFLEDLIANSKIKPMVNQFEFHPGLQQNDLIQYCFKNDIAVTSFGPLMKNEVFSGKFKDVIGSIAIKYNKSIAQVIFRWGLQKGIAMIPKSVTLSRIIENIQVYDFELLPDEINAINDLNIDERVYSNPTTNEIWKINN